MSMDPLVAGWRLRPEASRLATLCGANSQPVQSGFCALVPIGLSWLDVTQDDRRLATGEKLVRY